MILLNESQQEQLKEITANLRKIRQEKSIRIEEIAAQTHIRLASLRALEEWRFEELPEPVFIQGFIRRYAEVLGLDGMALAKDFQVNIFALDGKKSLDNSPKNSIFRLPPLFVPYILLILVASGGLIYLLKPQVIGKPFLKQRQPLGISQPKVSPPPVISPATPSSTPTSPTVNPSVPSPTITPSSMSTPNTTPTAFETSATAANVSNVAVTVELKGKSWLEIKADGKMEFAGTLDQGEHKTWTAKKDLSIRSGNAGVVWISVNQQQPEVLGEDGEVKEVTYTNQ